MDLSKIPTKDLEYIKAGQLDKVSTSSLQELAKQRGTPVAPSLSVMEPTPYNKVAMVNKRYSSKPDFVVGDIAVGIMEGIKYAKK